MHEYGGGYVGMVCVFFSLGALIGGTIALLISVLLLDDHRR